MNAKGLKALLERPSWSKDTVIWIGGADTLDGAVANTKCVELDLLDFFPEDEQLPASRDDRAELLRNQLVRKLQELKPTGPERVVLRVRNAALLARYGVGLQAVYDWFGGGQTLAILEFNRVKPVQLTGKIAEKVTFDPDWPVDYFRPLLAKPDNLCVEDE